MNYEGWPDPCIAASEYTNEMKQVNQSGPMNRYNIISTHIEEPPEPTIPSITYVAANVVLSIYYLNLCLLD